MSSIYHTTLTQLRPFSVGFDGFFNFAENFAFNPSDNFPKYDIIKLTGSLYAIELALAGYSKNDLSVVFDEGTLTVSHDKQEDKEEKAFLHKGISKRAFSKSFTLAENVKVTGASFVDGLLRIDLEKIVPEEKKAKTIKIA